MAEPFDASVLGWALEEVAHNAEGYGLTQNYYDGHHRLLFATEKFASAFGDLFQAFSDNLCPAIVDSLTDRLRIEAWEGPDNEAAIADALWANNRLPRIINEVFTTAGRDGDGYLLVWKGPLDPFTRIWPQRPENMAISYSQETPGWIDVAAKVWQQVDGRFRINVFWPDRIEKWVTVNPVKADEASRLKPEAFVPLATEGEINPVPNPTGIVPVFHLGNGADVGRLGRTELQDVIPLQDALNKSIADMLVAMEFHAMPQRWVTGLEVRIDPLTNKPANLPFTAGADRIWALPTTQGNFGQFDSADLRQFLEVQEGFRMEMARVSGRPPWVLGLSKGVGADASGEAMRTAESRLISLAKDRQESFGEVLREAMSLASQMDGTGPLLELEPVWMDPATRNERTEAEVQEIKQRLGVSKRRSLKELGYDEDEIEEMLGEAQEEAVTAVEAQMMAFEQGGAVSLDRARAARQAEAEG